MPPAATVEVLVPNAIVVHEPPVVELEVFSADRGDRARAVLDHFLKGRKETTLKAYKNDLRAFGEFLGTDDVGVVRLLRSWTRGQAIAKALEWQNAMADSKTFAPATRARRLGTLKALTQVMQDTEVIDYEIRLRGPKVHRLRDTAGPSEASIHKMLAVCGDYLDGKRNRVIIGIFVTMGLRRAELAELKIGDYDRERRRLSILGKGEEQRVWKDVPDELAELIEVWLAATGVTDPEKPLVHTLRNPGAGEPLSLRGLGHIVKSIGEKAHVGVWPHALRHAAGTVSLARGHDVLEVQGLLRHASLETTMHYDDNQKKRGSKASRDLARVFLGEKKDAG